MRILCTYICTLLIILAVNSKLHAEKYENTLLWKIEGNGMAKPSYLFGTIHLSNKQLFLFGDSVYRAIEQAEGLALELDLNELAAYYITSSFDEFHNEYYLEESMSDEEKELYRELLEKKFAKPVNKISKKDLIVHKNKWLTEYNRSGKMSTFVDAYLYGVARGLGKWTGGIEDIEDQMSLSSSDIRMIQAENEYKVLEAMVKIYTAEDLNAVDSFINSEADSASAEEVLIKRNRKMAQRIDSLMSLRTMFFAVGTAHLPGDEGLIKLLRERGFKVSPVISGNKIRPEDFTYASSPTPWQYVTDRDSLYSLKMPGNPVTVNLFGIIDTRCYFDIVNTTMYFSLMLPVSETKDTDSLYNGVAKNFIKQKGRIKGKKVYADGNRGAEYTNTNVQSGYLMRMQLYRKNKTLFCLYAITSREEDLNSPNVDSFFNSLKLYTPAEASLQTYEFADSTLALSVQTPLPLELNATLMKVLENNENWNARFYTGISNAEGMYVMLLSKRALPGMYIDDDSVQHSELQKLLAADYTVTRKDIKLQGYDGVEFTGKKAGATYVRVLSIVRGNCHVMLYTIAADSVLRQANMQNVFKSFKLLDYKQAAWTQQYDSLKAFSAISPAELTTVVDSNYWSNTVSYMTYDSFTATTYHILTDTLGKYTSAKSDTTFLAERLKDYYSETDSIEYSRMTANGALPAMDCLIRSEKGKYQRLRLVLNGNILYILFSYGEKKLITGPGDKFFNSFRVRERSGFDLYSNKTMQLLADLRSTDSATRQKAYNEIYTLKFDKEDLGILHGALFSEFPKVAGGDDSTDINKSLSRQLEDIADKSTVQYIGDNYMHLCRTQPKLGVIGLELLAAMKTQESYKMFSELLSACTPASGDSYALRYALKDSLELLAMVYPNLTSLAKDTAWGPMVADMTVTLVDSGIINRDILLTHEGDFIMLTHKLEHSIKNSEETYIYYSVPEVLARINTTASKKAMHTFLQAKNIYMKKMAAVLMVKSNETIPNDIISSIAENGIHRLDFYNELKEAGKESLFPRQYIKQKDFAESRMYDYLYYDDEVPDSMKLLTARELNVQGKKFKFYLYKISYNSGDSVSSFLGVHGAYSSNRINPDYEFNKVYWSTYQSGMEKEYDEEILFDFITERNGNDGE